jgi:hypothetical protein
MDQDAPRPLPVVPPPQLGEALASWLGRVAAEYRVSVATLLAHVKLPIRPNRWLSLPALPDSALEILSQRLRTPLALLCAMNATAFSLGAQAQLGFCPHCLKKDVALSRPLHWRRDWLDAFSVCCRVHHVALTPVGAATFGRCGNWQHAVMHPGDLLDLTAQDLDPTLAPHDASAHALQQALSINYCSVRRLAVYGVEEASQLRDIAMDLLDLLLGRFRVTKDPQDLSVLMRIAQLRDEPLALAELIIYPVWVKTHLITLVRSTRCRFYALSIANTLLMHSARLTDANENLRPKSDSALRMTWLWALMPDHVHELIIAKSRAWPRAYVQRCWPELLQQPNGCYLHRRAILGQWNPKITHCHRSVFELPRINTGQRPASQALCAGATKIKRQSQPVSGQVQPEGSQSRILA